MREPFIKDVFKSSNEIADRYGFDVNMISNEKSIYSKVPRYYEKGMYYINEAEFIFVSTFKEIATTIAQDISQFVTWYGRKTDGRSIDNYFTSNRNLTVEEIITIAKDPEQISKFNEYYEWVSSYYDPKDTIIHTLKLMFDRVDDPKKYEKLPYGEWVYRVLLHNMMPYRHFDKDTSDKSEVMTYLKDLVSCKGVSMN